MPDLTSTPNKQISIEPGEGLGTKQLLASKGALTSLVVYNDTAATIFIQKFNSLSAPVTTDTAPSRAPIPVAVDGYYESNRNEGFDAGLYIGISSTPTVYTAVTDDVWMDAQGQH